MRRWTKMVWLIGWFAPVLLAQEMGPGIFQLADLPKGKSVTLPRPALTQLSVRSEVQLTSTDSRQTVKFTSRGAANPLTLAIYDSQMEQVQTLSVTPQSQSLYIFKSLQTIRIVPKPDAAHLRHPTVLQIESDRPLELTR